MGLPGFVTRPPGGGGGTQNPHGAEPAWGVGGFLARAGGGGAPAPGKPVSPGLAAGEGRSARAGQRLPHLGGPQGSPPCGRARRLRRRFRRSRNALRAGPAPIGRSFPRFRCRPTAGGGQRRGKRAGSLGRGRAQWKRNTGSHPWHGRFPCGAGPRGRFPPSGTGQTPGWYPGR